ncbi:MAG: C4-dicarboxylate ABC transporter substrate-binding protein [Pikeienuella sp.]
MTKPIFGALVLALTLTSVEAAAATTEWKVSLWGKRRAFTEHVHRLADLVARNTLGEFRIAIHYGDLSPSRENLAGIAEGKFEMAQFCAGYHPEKNRAITVLELPFLGVDTLEEERALSQRVYADPAVAAEMARWNARLLMPTPLPQYNLAGQGTPPTDLSWFDGKRLRATGGIGRALSELGAETENLTATETFSALQSGTLDAVAFAQHAHFSFNTIALAEWWTANLNPGTVNCPVVVNIDAYERLPDAHRAALDAAIEPALDYYIENYRDLLGKWNVVLETFEVPVIRFEPEAVAALRARTGLAAVAGWRAETEAAGLPAEDLLALVERSLAEIRADASR